MYFLDLIDMAQYRVDYISISLNFLSTSFLVSMSCLNLAKCASAETLRLLWIKLMDRCLLDELAA